MAERRTFSMTGAMRLVLKWTVLIACSTRRPLIISRTSFAFCGLVRWNFASARNSRIFSTATLAMIFIFLEGQKQNDFPDFLYLGFAEVSAARAEWPLKVRVAENSPSLWPTMFSVT